MIFQNKFKNLDGPAFDTLDGKNHKARFGLSVACAGNINLDGITSENPKGIQDLVIGAPYDGEDHRQVKPLVQNFTTRCEFFNPSRVRKINKILDIL